MSKSVAELCVKHRLTTDELAEAAGLTPERAAAILLGRWTPCPTERRKVADALHASVEEIAWGHKTPIQHIYGHGPG